VFLKINILLSILKSIFTKTPNTRPDLILYQSKKLQQHLRFLQKKSPYFSKINLNDFSSIPLMNKSIMMKNFDQMNTVGLQKEAALRLAIKAERDRDFSPQIDKITIGLSSGTSGNKGLFIASHEDKAKYVSLIYQKVLRPIKFRKTRVALFFRANSNLYESTRSLFLKFKYFDITQAIYPQIAILAHFNPHILVAPPSVLNIIADYQATGKIKIRPEKIISVAEVLEEDVKIKLTQIFNQTIHQLYQCTEGFLGSTCSHGTIHLHEDYVKFEFKWIDDTQKRFHPIITDFTRRTQPIIRYELNDILQIRASCPCGSIFTPIEKIEGRSDDVFKMIDEDGAEVLIFPDQIRNTIIIASDTIENYTVQQIGANTVEVALYLPSDKSLEQAEDKIQLALVDLFLSKKIKHTKIQFTTWITLPLHQKQRRIVNRFNGN